MRTPVARLSGALLALLLAVTVAACGGGSRTSASAAEGRLSIGAAAVPASLDPRKSAPYEALWVGLLYDALVTRAEDGSYEPGLAESWEFTPDGLELTLRTGVTFQDGAPFDAEAVKANLDYSTTHSANFSNQLTSLEAVEVVDPTHVRLRMSDSPAPMLGVLAGEAGMMISPAALSREDLSTNPAGTGAYTLDRFVGTELEFTAWDGYWNRAAVTLPGVDVTVLIDETARLRALRSGQMDAAFITAEQVDEARSAGLQVTSSATADFWGVIVNTGQSEFADPLVRQAMMLGLDRPSIAQTLFGDGCVPSAQPFRPDDWAYVPGLDEQPAAQHDPERARQLLAEAGLPGGFTFELQTGAMQSYVRTAEVLQAQWAEIGITVDVRPMENVQFVTARRNGEFEATVSVYQTARPDPSEFVKTFYVPGGLFNPSGYELPGLADLLVQSSSSPDLAVRTPPMHQIMTDVLNDGPPVLPICTRTTSYAYRDNVHGLSVAPLFDSNLSRVSVDPR